MAKKSKSVEKQTRQLIEAMADLVKQKGDKYKFKTKKKKTVRRMKEQCVHWIMRKGEPLPTVRKDDNDPNMWRCRICDATFPVRPLTMDEYEESCDTLLAVVNQLQFLSVKMGGNADDTKLFLRLKMEIPKMKKVQKNIIKQVNKRQEWEDRKIQTDSMSQFNGYTGYDYR